MQNNTNKNKQQKVFFPHSKKASELCYLSVFKENADGAKKWISATYRPFKNYLTLARDAAQKKQNIDAAFFIVDKKKDYTLRPWLEIKVESQLVNGKIENDSLKAAYAKEFGLPVEPIEVKTISINGENTSYIENAGTYIVNASSTDEIVINHDKNILFSKNEYFSELVNYYGDVLEVRGTTVTISEYKGDICTDYKNSNIKYELKNECSSNGKNSLTIELIDNPSNVESVFEVFFNEAAVDVYFGDNRNKTYRILKKDKETGRLTIDVSKGRIDVTPKTMVHLSTDLSQLRKQENALFAITARPSETQETLLNLCKSDHPTTRLTNFAYQANNSLRYKILTDSSREGTERQREFVQKALQTPDFMILQGPPGSGKTTAILELIYQLLLKRKKVLLCASTHVAIDNVLEKIIKHENSRELLGFINPVRVGDEDNVYSDCVKPYVYSNITKDILPEHKQLVDESFNLVCGTTIGVLRFSLIDKAIENCSSNSIEPIFDYLILDEASKTTFSEFLVPGVLCKKWIIVGDVKQLAPYVEKNDLIPSLLTCEPLNTKDKRNALSFLNLYKNRKGRFASKDEKPTRNRCYIMGSSAIEFIEEHINTSSDLVVITSSKKIKDKLQKKQHLNVYVVTDEDLKKRNAKVAALSGYNTTFLIEGSLVKEAQPLFNGSISFFHNDIDPSSDTHFNEFAVARSRGVFGIEEAEKKNYSKELEDFSRKPEDELLWRLIRLYELNRNQSAAKGYQRYIDDFKELLNESEAEDFTTTIDTIKNVAIPSIIKILQEGVDSNSKYEDILHKGFNSFEKTNRFIMLDYQHRMHKDISQMSREYVYDGDALKDSKKWTSKMNYCNNKSRFEIRDVRGTTDRRNFNEDEVKAIIDELEQFRKYAKTNRKSNDTKYEIAILSFYNGQVVKLRQELQKMFQSQAKFNFRDENIHIALNTVDKFQGQEADIVYLSTVQTRKLGFLDSVNRVNVAITRAKEKLIIFGHKEFFKTQEQSDFLKKIFNKED